MATSSDPLQGGETPEQDMQEYQNKLGKETCTCTACTRDEVMAGTRLEVLGMSRDRASTSSHGNPALGSSCGKIGCSSFILS